MKRLPIIALTGIMIFLLTSCAKVYYSPDAKDLANTHKTIAILPPVVSISTTKKMSNEQLLEQQKNASVNLQNEIYSWLLKRKMQGKIRPEIQDISLTNSKLEKAGYYDNTFSPEKICEILGVDGTMGSNFALTQPLSQGVAIAVGVLFDTWENTNEITATLNIKDCANGKLIWNYSHNYSGSVGSSPANLVNELLRDASRKMPYN